MRQLARLVQMASACLPLPDPRSRVFKEGFGWVGMRAWGDDRMMGIVNKIYVLT